jgi:LPXTG-motif cell wall-anchored protein
MQQKLSQVILGGILLGSLAVSHAEPNIHLNNNGSGHVRQFNAANGHQNFHNINDGTHLNGDRFNNDTVNVNRAPYNNAYNNGRYGAPYNNYPPYHGWNEGQVGWNNGWNSGWSHGENNGGWGVGLVEGIVGGIAATALFNELFNHNSTPSVAYVNSGGSGSYDNSSYPNTQPTPEVINNDTTNTVINEDDGSNAGYWLVGIGVILLAGLAGFFYRRKQNSYNRDDEYDYEPVQHRHSERYPEDDDGYDERPVPPRHLGHRDDSHDYVERSLPNSPRKRPVRR